MSSEGQETGRESGFGHDERPAQKTVICKSQFPENQTMKASTSTGYTTKHSDMRSTSNGNYDSFQGSSVLKSNEMMPYDPLKGYYFETSGSISNNEQRSRSEEQPLDFSRKKMPSNKKDRILEEINKLSLHNSNFIQRSPENGASASDSIDDSCDGEIEHARFGAYSHSNLSSTPEEKYHLNGSRSPILEKRDRPLRRFPMKTLYEDSGNNKRRKTGLSSTDSSESEYDSSFDQYSIRKSNAERMSNGFHPKSPYSESLTVDSNPHHSQPTTSKNSYFTNGHSENGADHSVEKGNQFQIRNILTNPNYSGHLKERTQPSHPLSDSETIRRISPKPIPNNFDHRDIIFPRSVSPKPYMNLPASVSSQRVNDLPRESAVIVPSFMGAVLPPSHLANMVSPPDPSYYARHFPYPFRGMLQPPFNSIQQANQYHPTLQTVQNPKQKNLRPFKTIDPTALMNNLPITPSVAALGMGSSSMSIGSSMINHPDCNGSVCKDSSQSQRLSPDSQCLASGPSGNSNESLPQEANGEPARKKIRRIPPEQRDAKYIEKRAKNNIAAKKSRDERRRKEDLLAITCRQLYDTKVELDTKITMLNESLEIKERKFDLIMGHLISYRERIEGHAKEVFDETFKIYLSQQYERH